MTLFFTAPSLLERGIPFIFRLLVIPATTTFPNSSKRTTAGLSLTSPESANCTRAIITCPDLRIFPGLIFFIIPQLFHFQLLHRVKKLVILIVSFPIAGGLCLVNQIHYDLIVSLPRVFFDCF